jgi:hypothetical protein
LAVVLRIQHDGQDHAWITLAMATRHWAPMGRALRQGEPVFIFGNPRGLRDMMRRGYVVGQGADYIYFDFPNDFGDSGAAIFNERGEVVAMVHGVKHFPNMVLAVAKPIGAPK